MLNWIGMPTISLKLKLPRASCEAFPTNKSALGPCRDKKRNQDSSNDHTANRQPTPAPSPPPHADHACPSPPAACTAPPHGGGQLTPSAPHPASTPTTRPPTHKPALLQPQHTPSPSPPHAGHSHSTPPTPPLAADVGQPGGRTRTAQHPGAPQPSHHASVLLDGAGGHAGAATPLQR